MNTLILGIFLALAGGIVNNIGALLQKYAINKIPKEQREKGFYKKLFKSPSWVIGLILVVGATGVLVSLAHLFIGGALIPGLMAVGLIVLTIGAIKLLGEKLRFSEYFGIFLMITGIVLIGVSSLEITTTDMINLSNTNFIVRLAIYSIACLALWILTRQLGKKLEVGKSVFLALGAGLPFAFANAWMQPFFFLIGELINRNFTTLNILLFLCSLVIATVVNILGIIHVQDAFKHGDASKIYPISQIPQQIAPVILYYGIYLKSSTQTYSLYLLLVGIVVILVAGFLLGKKQGKLETMGLEKDKELEMETTTENEQITLIEE